MSISCAGALRTCGKKVYKSAQERGRAVTIKPDKHKLAKRDFAYTEKLLYMQKTHDTAIVELQAELEDMLPSATASLVTFDHNPKGGELTLTERVAERRLYSVKGKHLREEITRRRRHQKAISEAMKCLDNLELRLVHLKYYQEKTSLECCRAMGMRKSRWYEVRAEVVCKVARYLGLI